MTKNLQPFLFCCKISNPQCPTPFLKAGDSHEFDVVFVVEDNEKLESDDILKKSCHRNCKKRPCKIIQDTMCASKKVRKLQTSCLCTEGLIDSVLCMYNVTIS